MAGIPGGMTTANFIHSVANQIEEIQVHYFFGPKAVIWLYNIMLK
jgi:hypothetical protein